MATTRHLDVIALEPLLRLYDPRPSFLPLPPEPIKTPARIDRAPAARADRRFGATRGRVARLSFLSRFFG